MLADQIFPRPHGPEGSALMADSVRKGQNRMANQFCLSLSHSLRPTKVTARRVIWLDIMTRVHQQSHNIPHMFGPLHLKINTNNSHEFGNLYKMSLCQQSGGNEDQFYLACLQSQSPLSLIMTLNLEPTTNVNKAFKPYPGGSHQVLRSNCRSYILVLGIHFSFLSTKKSIIFLPHNLWNGKSGNHQLTRHLLVQLPKPGIMSRLLCISDGSLNRRYTCKPQTWATPS